MDLDRPNRSTAMMGDREKLAGDRIGETMDDGDGDDDGIEYWTMHWDRWNAMGTMEGSRNRESDRIRITVDRRERMDNGDECG